MPSNDRARHELDSWSGSGHVAVGMARQGYDRQLTRYDERGWRANFYTTGMEHSPTSATGTGWARTPWHATRAAWEALRKGSGGRPMNDRLEAISRLISAVARQEDQELRPLGRGIAFVPELAFAYLVGRAITARSSDIFGTPDIRWATDELIAGFGRSGLVFHPAAPGKAIVVEFKRKFGPNLSYLAHLNRLGGIDEHKYDRLFCGLMFSDIMKPIVEPLSDPRVSAGEVASNLRVRPAYSPFEYFETLPS